MNRKYEVDKISIKSLLSDIAQDRISMPEIQRPFVWDSTKVRDLIDSIHRGFPIGYIITSVDPTMVQKDGTKANGKTSIIDGQQRITALRASILGGFLFRLGIGALPFLLPLLMQVGFGLSPFRSGLVTFASAVGAMGMKTLAARIIRTFGFRNIMVINAIVSAVFSTTSLENENWRPASLLRSETSERTSSRASRSRHWFVAIDSSRSEYDSVVPPLLTRRT